MSPGHAESQKGKGRGSPGCAEQEFRSTDSHPGAVMGAQGAPSSHGSAEQLHAGSGACSFCFSPGFLPQEAFDDCVTEA